MSRRAVEKFLTSFSKNSFGQILFNQRFLLTIRSSFHPLQKNTVSMQAKLNDFSLFAAENLNFVMHFQS